MSATKLNKSAGARILSRTSRTRAIFREGRPLPDGRGTDRRRRIAHGHLALGFLGLLPVAVAVAAATGRSATGTYTIVDLGTLGGATSVALAINDLGQVCGGADIGGLRHAFLWDNGVMTDLGTNPPTIQSEAWGINNAGAIVGMSSNTGNGGLGFIWENGEMKRLLETSTSIQGYAINDHRHVVGIYRAPGGNDHAFLWEDGVLADLGTLGGSRSIAWDINDAGQVVGSSFTTMGEEAFLWEGGAMEELATLGGQTEAFGINDAGQIVGRSHPMGSFTPVLWENGEIIDLNELFGVNASTAYAINDVGQLITYGTLYDLVSGDWAFLSDLLAPDSGWSDLSARDLNNVGQIVGAGTINGFRHAFVMTPPPPPPIPTVSSWGILLMSLTLLAGATIVIDRSKRNKRVYVKEQ